MNSKTSDVMGTMISLTPTAVLGLKNMPFNEVENNIIIKFLNVKHKTVNEGSALIPVDGVKESKWWYVGKNLSWPIVLWFPYKDIPKWVTVMKKGDKFKFCGFKSFEEAENFAYAKVLGFESHPRWFWLIPKKLYRMKKIKGGFVLKSKGKIIGYHIKIS